jgi:hypothetical protein
MMGEFLAARATLAEGVRQYDFAKHRDVVHKIGQDPCMCSLCHEAQTLWTLGYADRAEEKAVEALELARKLSHPFTLSYCLSNLAIDCLVRREDARVVKYCDEGIVVCLKHDLTLHVASLKAYSFIAQLALGKRQSDLARLREIAQRPIPEYQLLSTCYRSTLAEVLGMLGDLETAFTLLAQAKDLMERNDERFVEPDIYRIKGELTIKSITEGAKSRGEIESARSDAEFNFRQAIEVATRSGAKMFELRATVSLARLLLGVGRKAEALDTLASCYSWFTEGFETPEMKAAASLIEGRETARPGSG